MRTVSIILLLLSAFSKALAQHVSIFDLSIQPSNPSDQDSIFLHSLTGMSNSPITVQSENVADSGSFFIVDVCQWAGPGDAYMELPDTFYLGTKPPGHYKVYFIGNGTYCGGFQDNWIDSIEFDIGYASLNEKSSRIDVYPNPSNTGKINITGIHLPYKYQLIDTKGSIIRQETISDADQVDLANVPSGIYFLILNSEGIINRQKIVIQ
jgi:hypothetical protein